MIIEKFENMTTDKYKKLLQVEKRIFSYYKETKEKNYDEITIEKTKYQQNLLRRKFNCITKIPVYISKNRL